MDTDKHRFPNWWISGVGGFGARLCPVCGISRSKVLGASGGDYSITVVVSILLRLIEPRSGRIAAPKLAERGSATRSKVLDGKRW